jgi:hypothetical protein
MDIAKILAELKADRKEIEQAIGNLDRLARGEGRKPRGKLPPPNPEEPPPNAGSAAQVAFTGYTRSRRETRREPT